MNKIFNVKIFNVLNAARSRFDSQIARRVLGNGETQILGGGYCVHICPEGYVSFSGAYADAAERALIKARAIGPLPRTNTARRVYTAAV